MVRSTVVTWTKREISLERLAEDANIKLQPDYHLGTMYD